MRILVVEDDPAMRRILERGLGALGHTVTGVDNGVDGMIAAGEGGLDAAAVDVMLPGMSGFEFCRHLRTAGDALPILLLTARDGVSDRVQGLDSGADDYLPKPFALDELDARLRALDRRRHGRGPRRITAGALTLEPRGLRATCGDRELPLSPREFAVLRMLAAAGGELVTREELLARIWHGHAAAGGNVIDRYVSYLRRKLEGPGAPRIRTVRGRGYRLEAPGDGRDER